MIVLKKVGHCEIPGCGYGLRLDFGWIGVAIWAVVLNRQSPHTRPAVLHSDQPVFSLPRVTVATAIAAGFHGGTTVETGVDQASDPAFSPAGIGDGG